MKDFPGMRGDLDGDALLRVMISLLGQRLQGFSLTVAVQGTVFTGLAVSRDEWVSLWLDGMRSAGAAGGMIADHFEVMIENNGIYIIDDDLPEVDPPTYLHMKDVKMLRTGLVDTLPLWRVRFEAISAWSPGSLAQG